MSSMKFFIASGQGLERNLAIHRLYIISCIAVCANEILERLHLVAKT